VRYSANLSLWGYFFNFLGGLILLVLSLKGLLMASALDSMRGTLEILMLVLLLVSLGVLLVPFISRKSTELVVTDKRVIAKFGLISTRSIEIRLDKVESVRVQQGLVGRIFNYGDIMITGTGTSFDPIPRIAGPLAFRNALNDAMERRAAAGPDRPN
jgi:uncharacterized membrane protein YdbT with pleckstrin-like domain